MKNTMLIGALLCSTILVAQQPQKERAGYGMRHADNMRKTLQLTDEQHTKIMEIRSSYRKRFDELRNASDNDTRRDAFQTIRKKRDAEISAVLTETQRVKWNELKDQRRTQKSDSRKGRIDGLNTKLDLSDQQKENVMAARRKFSKQMVRVRQDTAMTREDRRNEIQRIKSEYDKEMKSVLTKSQYEQWISAKKSSYKRRHNTPDKPSQQD